MVDTMLTLMSIASFVAIFTSVDLLVVRCTMGAISVLVITVAVVCVVGSFGVMAGGSVVMGEDILVNVSITLVMFGIVALVDNGVVNWGFMMDGGLVALSGGLVVINILMMGVRHILVLMIGLEAEWVMVLMLVMSVVRVVLSGSMVTLIGVHVTVVMA